MANLEGVGTVGQVAKVRNVAFRGFPDGSVEFLGDQIEWMTGYSRQQFNSKSMKWLDIVLEEDRPRLKQVFVQALRGDKTYTRDYRIKTRNGDILWLGEWSQIVCDDKGQIDFITGIIMDITEQKQEEILRAKCERRTGKYLTFSMAGQEYGISIMNVKEIIEVMPITPVPQAPSFLKGVINLRGKVIPIVDLRTKFGLAEREHMDRTCIIVLDAKVRSNGSLTGIVVDSVSDVLHIKGSDIEDNPSYLAGPNTEFILGMAKVDKSLKLILEVDKVLSGMELLGLRNVA